MADVSSSQAPVNIGIDGSISGGSTNYALTSANSTPTSARFPQPPSLYSHPSQQGNNRPPLASPAIQHDSPFVVQPHAHNPPMSLGQNGTGIQHPRSQISPYPQQQFQSLQQQPAYYYNQGDSNPAGPSGGYGGAEMQIRGQARSPSGGMVNGVHPGQAQGRHTSYNGQGASFEYATNGGASNENRNGNATAGPSRMHGSGGAGSRSNFNVHELFRSNPGSAPNPYASPYQPRPSPGQSGSYGATGMGAVNGMGLPSGSSGGAPNQSPYPTYMANNGQLNMGYMGPGGNPSMQQNPYANVPPNGYPPYGMDPNYQYSAYPYPQYPHHNPYQNMQLNNPYAQPTMLPQHLQPNQHYQQPQPILAHQHSRHPVSPSPTLSSTHVSPYPSHYPASQVSSSGHPPPQELVSELVPPPPISNLTAFSPPALARVAELPAPRSSSAGADEVELGQTPVFASIMRNQRATPPMMVPLQLPERTIDTPQTQLSQVGTEEEPMALPTVETEMAAEVVGVEVVSPLITAVEPDTEVVKQVAKEDPVAGNFSPALIHTSLQPSASTFLTFSNSMRIPAGLPIQAATRPSGSPEREDRREKGTIRSQEEKVRLRKRLTGRGEATPGNLTFGDFPPRVEQAAAPAARPTVEPASVLPEAILDTDSVVTTAEANGLALESSIAIDRPVTPSPSAGESAERNRTSAEPSLPVAETVVTTSAPETTPIPPPAPGPTTKAPIKSWAALVRGPVKATPKVATPGPSSSVDLASAAPSGFTSPNGSIVALPATSAAYTPSTAPGTPTTTMNGSQTLPPGGPSPRPIGPVPSAGYAAAAAVGAAVAGGYPIPNGIQAWGTSHRFTYEDMGKLLLEGVLNSRSIAAKANNSPRGLINTGNMCFANSILQVLAYCAPFAGLFEELGRRVTADLGRRTPLIEAMVIFLREFIALDTADAKVQRHAPGQSELLPSPFPAQNSLGYREPFVPTYVYEAMKENKRFDSMRRGHQEDAEEFLGFFLETLHEELLYLYSRHQSRNAQGIPLSLLTQSLANGDEADEREVARPVSPSAVQDDGWLEVGKKQKVNVVRTTQSKDSAISRIFGGKLRSVLHTPGQKDSITLEPYQPLQLEIAPTNVITVTDAFIHLNEAETIPGVWSESRKTQVDATKQTFIEILPEMLVLHLKRFTYDGERVVKRGKPIAYGPELVIPTEVISPPRRAEAQRCTYKLIGVVYHHGKGASGGHYTSCVLKQDGTGWLHLDDEAVTEVTLPEVVVTRDAALKGETGTIGYAGREKCPYLLFYQLAR